MQTRNLLFSVVLCSMAHVAAAECNVQAQSAQPGPEGLQKVAMAEVGKQPAGPKNLGDMLIKTADASQPPGRVQPAMPRAVAAESSPAEERRPRATTAMLLTALAVMFAIALRRARAED